MVKLNLRRTLEQLIGLLMSLPVCYVVTQYIPATNPIQHLLILLSTLGIVSSYLIACFVESYVPPIKSYRFPGLLVRLDWKNYMIHALYPLYILIYPGVFDVRWVGFNITKIPNYSLAAFDATTPDLTSVRYSKLDWHQLVWVTVILVLSVSSNNKISLVLASISLLMLIYLGFVLKDLPEKYVFKRIENNIAINMFVTAGFWAYIVLGVTAFTSIF